MKFHVKGVRVKWVQLYCIIFLCSLYILYVIMDAKEQYRTCWNVNMYGV